MIADLRSLDAVRNLARKFKKNRNGLHVLINNFTIIPKGRRATGDGLGEQFRMNHPSHFLLTHLLLDVLIASASRGLARH